MQNYASQEYEIRKYCEAHEITVDKWLSESMSGTVAAEKRLLGKAMRKMKKGDLLICTELSRLGRSMLMIMGILNICSSRGIAIHTIKDNFDLSDNINSKIIAFAFALAAEIERNLISQRTKEALAAKRMEGIVLGRPRGSSRKKDIFLLNREEITRLLASGESVSSVARRYGFHRSTLSSYLRDSK